jgi:hypothetical protein
MRSKAPACNCELLGSDRRIASRAMDIGNESNQADRAISTGKLNALLRLHTRPINVVVYHGSV